MTATAGMWNPSEMPFLFLTGFMGTGKSSIGSRLAHRLGCRFYDLDAEIVSSSGACINTIFATQGEASFRRLETEALSRLVTGEAGVVATGGGAVLAAENRRIMRQFGIIVNLTASPKEIQRRLWHEKDRPLLQDDKSLDKIAAMLEDRAAAYADADFRISTEGMTVSDLVAEIYLLVMKERTP